MCNEDCEKIGRRTDYFKRKIRISYDDDAGTIYNKIISLGKPLLLKSLKNIIANKYQLIDQKDDDACYAKKIEKIESRIFWNELAENINLKVRAFNPFPGAWTFLSGTDLRIKILKSKVIYKNSSENEKNLLIGNVNENMEVKCGKII